MFRRALAASILALAAAALAADEARKEAIFLVAGEELKDPNFERTVVLVTHAAAFPGPFGVIVNRPTTIPLKEALPDEKSVEKAQDKIYVGGPVAVGKLIYVFRSPSKPADSDTVAVVDGVNLSWSPGKLKELLKRERPTEGLRIYAGHAAWAPGQLESEVSRGFWKSARVDARSLFETPAHLLWPELSRRASMTTARLGDVPGATQGGSP
jgi:putative transcriptional regulator